MLVVRAKSLSFLRHGRPRTFESHSRTKVFTNPNLMKSFLYLALGIGALLASPSAQAHCYRSNMLPPVHIEREVKPVLTYSDVVSIRSERTVVALASPFTGPTPRASFSAPRVSTSFRSTPTYRSFSPAPSRSYSFSRTSSPSISSRPAATSAPRTYTYSISGVPHTKAYSPARTSQPAEVHHYHNSGGGGGLSAIDVILLNQALNSGHQSQEYARAGPTHYSPSGDIGATQSAEPADEGISGWGIFWIIIFCLGIAGAVCFGLHRLTQKN